MNVITRTTSGVLHLTRGLALAAWMTALAAPCGAAEASPIVVGNKVFMLTEGQRVLCARAATGQTLWERATHAPADSEAAQWEQAIRLQCEWAGATDRARRLNRELRSLKTDAQQRKQPVDQAAAATLAKIQPAEAKQP